jgi:hypothetical protein
MLILRPSHIWFPAGNRQVVERLDNGNRIETIWTRDRIAYRKLWNILKGRCRVSALGAKSVYLLVL